jgi:hypothetical protein
VLLVLLSFSFGHCVALLSVPFVLSIVLLEQHNGQKKKTEGQATQWPKERGQKDKQHNGQKKRTEGQATQ